MSAVQELKDLRESLKELSTQISQRTREAAAGLIAVWWALLIADSPSPGAIATHLKDGMLGLVVLAAATVLFDFAQYLAGYEMTRRLFHEAERQIKEKQNPDLRFDRESSLWLTRLCCFYLKQVTIAVALSWFIFVLVRELI